MAAALPVTDDASSGSICDCGADAGSYSAALIRQPLSPDAADSAADAISSPDNGAGSSDGGGSATDPAGTQSGSGGSGEAEGGSGSTGDGGSTSSDASREWTDSGSAASEPADSGSADSGSADGTAAAGSGWVPFVVPEEIGLQPVSLPAGLSVADLLSVQPAQLEPGRWRNHDGDRRRRSRRRRSRRRRGR